MPAQNPFKSASFIKVDYTQETGYLLHLTLPLPTATLSFMTGFEPGVMVNLLAANGVRHFDLTERLVNDIAAFAAFRAAAVIKGVI